MTTFKSKVTGELVHRVGQHVTTNDLFAYYFRLNRGSKLEHEEGTRSLQRSYQLGAWLTLGRKKCAEEKTSSQTGTTFRQWLRDSYNLCFSHCYNLMKLFSNYSDFPPLVYCSVSLRFILTHLNRIMRLCKEDLDFGMFWRRNERHRSRANLSSEPEPEDKLKS